MNSFIKNIFLMLMGVVVAALLYFAFFGYTPSDDDYYTGDAWRGALWYMAESLETPLSKYYYSYCFTPSVRRDRAVNEALGGTLKYGDINTIETNLSNATFEMYDFSSNSTYYSTGWK